MTNRKAIDVFNKWMDCKDAYQADPSCDGNCYSCEYYASAEEEREAMTMAISALEKQEQANTQNINSTHTSRPNALESLNILEQAKDDKGCVPMSLVRQAFRNVMEQDRWIPCSEKPEYDFQNVLVRWHDKRKGCEKDYYLFEGYVVRGIWCGLFEDADISNFEPIEWKPLEPYTEEES